MGEIALALLVFAFFAFMFGQSYNGQEAEGAVVGLLAYAVSAILFLASCCAGCVALGIRIGKRKK